MFKWIRYYGYGYRDMKLYLTWPGSITAVPKSTLSRMMLIVT